MSTVKLLSATDLSDKGITFSRQHRHRLIRQGRFPAPVKLGAATNGFIEAEIDAWIEAKIAERNASIAGKTASVASQPDGNITHARTGT